MNKQAICISFTKIFYWYNDKRMFVSSHTYMTEHTTFRTYCAQSKNTCRTLFLHTTQSSKHNYDTNTQLHTHTHTHTHTHMHVCTHVHMFACTHTHTYKLLTFCSCGNQTWRWALLWMCWSWYFPLYSVTVVDYCWKFSHLIFYTMIVNAMTIKFFLYCQGNFAWFLLLYMIDENVFKKKISRSTA